MNVAALCQRKLIVADQSQPLSQGAALMREHHVGTLVVTAQGPAGTQVLGLVTDRDLVVDGLARGAEAARLPLAELVGGTPVTVSESAGLDEAVDAMVRAGVRRLLVTDAGGRLVGLLSFDDLLPACAAPLVGLARVVQARTVLDDQRHPAPPPAPAVPALHVPAMGTAGWRSGAPGGAGR